MRFYAEQTLHQQDHHHIINTVIFCYYYTNKSSYTFFSVLITEYNIRTIRTMYEILYYFIFNSNDNDNNNDEIDIFDINDHYSNQKI